ncbi:MAG: adenylyltransferase/cytidyltransferase family protein [bacterium]
MRNEFCQTTHQGNGYCKGNGFLERIATSGGTFDTLHSGHKEYLCLAFDFAERVRIYVTSDNYVKSKKNYKALPYHTRVKKLKKLLNTLGVDKNRYEIRQLESIAQVKNELFHDDIYVAIVVPEYYALLRHVNKKRLDNGKNRILILVKERTRDHNHGDLSSTVIRRTLKRRSECTSNGRR